MDDDERMEANKETVAKLKRLQDDIQTRTQKQMAVLQSKARKTFRDLRAMIWVTFLFGVVLIVAALLLFLFQQRTLEVLGLGSLGVADWLALFLYKPMDRLQKANADFAQQVMILKSWVLATHLQLLAMNVNEPDTVRAAAKNVRTAAVEAARAIQEFVEQ
jgi:uncharacterized membrane protein (DUF106 family)